MLYHVLLTISIVFITSPVLAGVSVNGDSTGHTVETNNSIIVNGLYVNQNNAREAAVKIDNPHGKRIIVKDVRITTKNGVYKSNEGASAAMVIDAGDGSLEVDNVHIDAYGNTRSNAKAKGTANACAALYCSQSQTQRTHRSYERTKVTVHGDFESIAEKRK